MRRLNVFYNATKVGVLTERFLGTGYVFVYDNAYATSPSPPISLTLPKRIEPYEADNLFPFFTNLLPEGTLRRVICRAKRIDEADFFGMLMATVDTDMIGAVSFRVVEDAHNC